MGSNSFITPLCTTCHQALRLPVQKGAPEGYTPVGKYDFVYTSSHTFDPSDSHDGTCGFYAFLLGTMRSGDITAMVRDQTGLEEQVMRMQQPPFVMYTEFWFRDNFMDSQREMDEQLLIGSLYFPLNPGMSVMFQLFEVCPGWGQSAATRTLSHAPRSTGETVAWRLPVFPSHSFSSQ